MRYRDTAEESDFRSEVRSFIRENLPAELSNSPYAGFFALADPGLMRAWVSSLAARRWLASFWPEEFGGGGLSVAQQFILSEELAEARAPRWNGSGVYLIGPIIIQFGSDEQRRLHLPGIANGEVLWCQGYSEPEAGSDLASVRTRAVNQGDGYLLNGQKIWTSFADRADWMFLLARTDPDAPKHKGISMFLLNLRSPGVSIRPIVDMAQEQGFNEVFFEDVWLPKESLVGEENRGWYLGAALLDFERSDIATVIRLLHEVEDLVTYVRENGLNGADRKASPRMELADRAIEAQLARLLSYRVIDLQKRGEETTRAASINKLFRSELEQRIAVTGMRVLGLHGLLRASSHLAPLRGRFARELLVSASATVESGTSEIQRNVIATRGLGLPRS